MEFKCRICGETINIISQDFPDSLLNHIGTHVNSGRTLFHWDKAIELNFKVVRE